MKKFFISSVFFNVLFVGLLLTGVFLYLYENEDQKKVETQALTAAKNVQAVKDPAVAQMNVKAQQLYREFDSLNKKWRRLLRAKCPKYMVLWPDRFSGAQKPSQSQIATADALRKKWNSFNVERRRLFYVIEFLEQGQAGQLNIEPKLLLAKIKSLYEDYIKVLEARNEAVREFSQILETCA